MAAFKNFPVPLKEKLVTVIFIAAFILFAGSVAAVVFKDIIMFILSLLLCVFNLIRAVSLYKTVSGNKYEIVEGRCTEISSVLIRKQKKIKIATEDGNGISYYTGAQKYLSGKSTDFISRQRRKSASARTLRSCCNRQIAFWGMRK